MARAPKTPGRIERMRRLAVVLLIVAVAFGNALWTTFKHPKTDTGQTLPLTVGLEAAPAEQPLAKEVLAGLEVKGRAPRTDYSRQQFGGGWAEQAGCDTRNLVLRRDLVNAVIQPEDGCTVLKGTLYDPYTGEIIEFVRGPGTSSKVQVDHVVALSDAWQKGAQQLDETKRQQLANDQLNLLAVDGPANQNKGGSDAASWLLRHKTYRCRYVARQIAVKAKYSLWVTDAEAAAMQRILATCPSQVVPVAAS